MIPSSLEGKVKLWLKSRMQNVTSNISAIEIFGAREFRYLEKPILSKEQY